jgi:hypothetical protein
MHNTKKIYFNLVFMDVAGFRFASDARGDIKIYEPLHPKRVLIVDRRIS